MKTLLLSIMMLPLFALAQDCTLKKGTDEFTNQPNLSTGFVSLGSGGNNFYLSIDATKKEIIFFFTMKGGATPKCFNEESEVTIIYEDGKFKTELKHTGTSNCDGVLQLTFRNTSITTSNLQKLSTKRVATLKIAGSDKTIEIPLNEEDRKLLMQLTACVTTQAKTLL